jgi:hypothetical protein
MNREPRYGLELHEDGSVSTPRIADVEPLTNKVALAVRELCAENDRLYATAVRYREALELIRDHGTVNGHECWAWHRGDCADVFQETARTALNG